MTILIHNLWPMKSFRQTLAKNFPDVEQERLTSTDLKITVPESLSDEVLSRLQSAGVTWEVAQ